MELKLYLLLDVVLLVILLNVNLRFGSLDRNVFFFFLWASNRFRSYKLIALIGPVVLVNSQPFVLELDVDWVLHFQEPVCKVNTHLCSPRVS